MSNAKSMSRKRSLNVATRWLAVLALGAASASLQAAPVIFTNGGPDGTGNASSSQNDPGGFGNFATTYDDFTLCTNPAICTNFTITDVHWTGEFFNPASEATPSDFEIKFYSDNLGQPGALVAGGAFSGLGNPKNVGACPIIAGFPTCTYNVNLPGAGLSLAGGHYWMSIVADVGFPPQWGWSASGAGNGTQDFFGTRTPTGLDYAFDLTGTTNRAGRVPEPATLALFGVALAGLGFSRRRKQG